VRLNCLSFGNATHIFNSTSNDTNYRSGNEGEVIAIGPFIGYRPSLDWGVLSKWQHETHAENRAQGNRFILQLLYRLL
jgi:hypothetical protein